MQAESLAYSHSQHESAKQSKLGFSLILWVATQEKELILVSAFTSPSFSGLLESTLNNFVSTFCAEQVKSGFARKFVTSTGTKKSPIFLFYKRTQGSQPVTKSLN